MPSKKNRVASRQAQLSQRRRRERNRERRADPAPGPDFAPRAAPAAPGAQEEANGSNDVVTPAPVGGPSVASSAVRQTGTPRQPGRPRRRGAANRVDPVPTYTHLRGEVRHIGIVTSVIVVFLVVLTVILR